MYEEALEMTDSKETVNPETVTTTTKRTRKKASSEPNVSKTTKAKKVKKVKKVNKTDIETYQCRYCQKVFRREATLETHSCPKKARYLDKDKPETRLAFYAYAMFYHKSVKSKRDRTIDDFIGSTFYVDFIKFGNYLIKLNTFSVEAFVRYLLIHDIKIRDWTSSDVYDAFMLDYIKNEDVEIAVERSIVTISDWCEKNNVEIKNFFDSVGNYEAAYMIKRGRLSPWVIYLSNSGDKLFSRFNQENTALIKNLVNCNFWENKFLTEPDSVEFAKVIIDGFEL